MKSAKKTAIVLSPNGQSSVVSPDNGNDFSLEQAQSIVGGYVEVIPLKNGKIMILNEEGKLKDLTLNRQATDLAHESYLPADDYIVGHVIVCESSMFQ